MYGRSKTSPRLWAALAIHFSARSPRSHERATALDRDYPAFLPQHFHRAPYGPAGDAVRLLQRASEDTTCRSSRSPVLLHSTTTHASRS